MFNLVLSKKGLTVERLQRFCEIVEAGSIAKAVKKNDREQPAYSRDLKALEDYFEEDLFKKKGATRSGKTLQGLTLRGDLLYRTALRFFSDVERVISYNEASTDLVIAAEESVMFFLITRLISVFKHEIPESKIHLKCMDLPDILPAIINHDIHFAVAGSSLLNTEAENISTVSVGEIEYKIYATKAFLKSNANIDEMPISSLESTKNLVTTLGVSPSVTFPSAPHLLAAVNSGSTAAFLPSLIDSDELTEVPLPAPCKLPLSFAWNTLAAEENPYIASVVSTLEQLLKTSLSS